jgi:CHAD domain-containing protein
MGEFNKWFECDDPARPAGDDAAAALVSRLELVPSLLANAARGDDNVEAVHQLRVATRRSRAALGAFRKFLPKRRRRRMQRRLSELRKAAGAARDLDVLAERRAAQSSIEELARDVEDGRLERQIARLVRRVVWRGKGTEPSFRELARKRLGDGAGEFLAAAAGKPRAVEDLHALRIAAKHLRYSIELFATAFSSAKNNRQTDEVYPTIEAIQERLGRLNDHATAAQRIEGWRSAQAAPGVNAAPASAQQIVELEHRRMATARDAFFEWWNETRVKELTEQLDDWSQSKRSNLCE